jgi:hypothetical protein
LASPLLAVLGIEGSGSEGWPVLFWLYWVERNQAQRGGQSSTVCTGYRGIRLRGLASPLLAVLGREEPGSEGWPVLFWLYWVESNQAQSGGQFSSGCTG